MCPKRISAFGILLCNIQYVSAGRGGTVNTSMQRFFSVITAMLVLVVSVHAAEDHVVPLRELQHELQVTAEQRARNAADIERVFSYPAAVKELAKYNVQ